LQSSVFAQRLEIDSKSDFSAELSKLVVRSARCDQFEPSPDGTCDSLATGFSSSFEKLFGDFYSDFFCFGHGRTIVISSPASIPVLYMVNLNEVLARALSEAQTQSSWGGVQGLQVPWRPGAGRKAELPLLASQCAPLPSRTGPKIKRKPSNTVTCAFSGITCQREGELRAMSE
jgi:hypothetical protein